MGTIARDFYFTTTEQDFTASGEVDIRKLETVAGPANATTICSHPNAAGTTQITLDPYTTRSTQGNIAANLGWAINRLSADGMESVANARRIIPAGVWQFVLNVSVPVAGGVTGTITVSAIFHVYRVSSSGARTLLFTATTNTVQASALIAISADPVTANSASQPQYILEPDETIHVGVVSNAVQVAGLLGATTAGTVTWSVGLADKYVRVPAPGIRTLYQDNNSAVGTGSGNKALLIRKDIQSAIGEGVGTQDYIADFFRAFNAVGKGDGFRQLLVVFKSIEAFGLGVGYTTKRLYKDLIDAMGQGTAVRSTLIRKDLQAATGVGTGTLSKLLEFFREFDSIGEASITRSTLLNKDTFFGVGEGAGVFQRKQELARSFNSIGLGDGVVSKMIAKATLQAIGEGDGDLLKATIFVRDFLAVGEGVPTEDEVVVFVRAFLAIGKATIRPRIALDWDDLPEPGEGGGGTTINVIPVFTIFDC